MTKGGRSRPARGDRTRSAAAVAPARGQRLDHEATLLRLLPSGRSVLTTVAMLLAVAAAYAIAKETSVFAVDRIEVRGAVPRVAAEVEAALAPVRGQSLAGVDLDRARLEVERLPSVSSVTFDRGFPHTLHVAVTPERAVAVIRQGPASYLVSARGRIMRAVARTAGRALPRIWASRAVTLAVGGFVGTSLTPSVRAVSPLRSLRFPARVRSVSTVEGDLVLRLRSGLEVRMGEPVDLDLKLAAAGIVIPKLGEEMRYLDVSVPERPVAGPASVLEPPAALPTAATAEPAATAHDSRPEVELDAAGSTSTSDFR